MRESQKLESLGVLASGIAHDFNNLLVGIMGNAGVALADLPRSSDIREPIEEIEDASKRASELTRQLLAYAGKGKFNIEAVDVSLLVRAMTSLVSAATNAPVELRLDEPGPVVRGDATQLRQVVMNLLTNAADASVESGGLVVVRSGVMFAGREFLEACNVGRDLPSGQYAFIEVEDSGCGMAPEIVDRIFDPFFTTKTAGRGLGLAATLGIARGHGGALWVASRPGRGTTFRLLCPLADAPCESEMVVPTVDTSIEGATVLVVDDEAHVSVLLDRVLTRAGCRAICVARGEEALDVLAINDAVDIVILDVTMPGMSGRETYRRMRELRADVPIVLCSGQSPEDYADLVTSSAHTSSLTKPFGIAALGRVLGGVLQR